MVFPRTRGEAERKRRPVFEGETRFNRALIKQNLYNILIFTRLADRASNFYAFKIKKKKKKNIHLYIFNIKKMQIHCFIN